MALKLPSFNIGSKPGGLKLPGFSTSTISTERKYLAGQEKAPEGIDQTLYDRLREQGRSRQEISDYFYAPSAWGVLKEQTAGVSKGLVNTYKKAFTEKAPEGLGGQVAGETIKEVGATIAKIPQYVARALVSSWLGVTGKEEYKPKVITKGPLYADLPELLGKEPIKAAPKMIADASSWIADTAGSDPDSPWTKVGGGFLAVGSLILDADLGVGSASKKLLQNSLEEVEKQVGRKLVKEEVKFFTENVNKVLKMPGKIDKQKQIETVIGDFVEKQIKPEVKVTDNLFKEISKAKAEGKTFDEFIKAEVVEKKLLDKPEIKSAWDSVGRKVEPEKIIIARKEIGEVKDELMRAEYKYERAMESARTAAARQEVESTLGNQVSLLRGKVKLMDGELVDLKRASVFKDDLFKEGASKKIPVESLDFKTSKGGVAFLEKNADNLTDKGLDHYSKLIDNMITKEQKAMFDKAEIEFKKKLKIEFDGDLETQYQSLKDLAKKNYKSMKAFLSEAEDVDQIAALAKRKGQNMEKVDQIFYSQKKNQDEILTIFKERMEHDLKRMGVLKSDQAGKLEHIKEILDSVRIEGKQVKEIKKREVLAAYKKVKALQEKKELNSVVIGRLKKKHGVKEWKNATVAQIQEVGEDLKLLEKGDVFLSRNYIEALKEFGITELTTKREAVEMLGDVKSWTKRTNYLMNFFRTIDRKIEVTAGKDAEKLKEILTRPRAKAVTKMIQEETLYKREIERIIFKKLGLKKKKNRALIQRWGEKRMASEDLFKYTGTVIKKLGLKKHRDLIEMGLQGVIKDSEKYSKLPNKLKQKIGDAVRAIDKKRIELGSLGELGILKQQAPKKWQEIVKADRWFRQKYDQLLEQTNAELLRFYPEHSDKIIPYRQDYYTHSQELNNFWQQIMYKGGDISPVLEGISEFTRPNAKFNPFSLERKGDIPFVEDAVKAFESYLPFVLHNKHMTESIIRHKAVQDILAHATIESKNINMFINSLHKAADVLSGKTSQVDRAIMDNVVGRKVIKIINQIDRKFAANRIVGSVSSALMQTAGVPNSIIKNGFIDTTYGLYQQVWLPFTKTDPAKKSAFLIRRYSDRATTIPTITEKGGEFLALPFELVETSITKSIWRATYSNTKRQGFTGDKLIQRADEITERIVGSRALGEKALAYESGLLSLPLRFQLEVGTHVQLWKTEVFDKIFKDPKTAKWFTEPKQATKAAIEGAIALYVFNTFYEATLGRTPLPDPIRAIGDLEEMEGWKEKMGRIAGEGLSSIPGGQFIANLAPETFRKKYFGRTEVGIYAGGIPVISAIRGVFYKKANAIYDFVLPYGGAQLKRIIQGIEGLEKMGSYNSKGKLQFPINRDQYMRVLLFGKYSTKEAREYFDKSRSPLTELQTLEYFDRTQEGEDPQTVYDELTKKRRSNEYKKEIVKKLIKKIKQNPVEGLSIIQVYKAEGIVDKKMEEEILDAITPAKSSFINRVGEDYRYMDLREIEELPKDLAGKRLDLKEQAEKLISKDHVLKAAPSKLSIGVLVQTLKNKLPWLEKPVEKRLKIEVLNDYNWTPEAVSEIENVRIRDVSPVVEVVLGLIKGQKEYGGSYTPAHRALFASVGPVDIVLNKKEKLEVASYDTYVTAHEMLHHFFHKFHVGDYASEFNKEWEKISAETSYQSTDKDKEINQFMGYVDDILMNNPLYKDRDEYSIANERFAFMGSERKKQEIPDPLRKYYDSVFKAKQ